MLWLQRASRTPILLRGNVLIKASQSNPARHNQCVKCALDIVLPVGDGPCVLVPVHAAYELEQLEARPDAQRTSRCRIYQHFRAARRAGLHAVCIFVDAVSAAILYLSRLLVICLMRKFLVGYCV